MAKPVRVTADCWNDGGCLCKSCHSRRLETAVGFNRAPRGRDFWKVGEEPGKIANAMDRAPRQHCGIGLDRPEVLIRDLEMGRVKKGEAGILAGLDPTFDAFLLAKSGRADGVVKQRLLARQPMALAPEFSGAKRVPLELQP